MFKDRKDAGEKLGKALERYADSEGILLGIPRGGVEVAYYVAQHLRLPLSLVVVRKLPFPDDPECGFGAIAEDGSIYLRPFISGILSQDVTSQILQAQTREMQRRIQILRDGKKLPEIAGKHVILIDDGIAMGSTMRAAVMLCRNQQAGKVIAAAPVGSPSSVHRLSEEVDETIVLEQPPYFRAVAQFYQNWYDVPDEEVISLMHKYQRIKNL